jgi:hypothetical protein
MGADDYRDLDQDDEAEPAGALALVPGVYNYCDAWCERCVFQLRCVVFRDRILMHATIDLEQDLARHSRTRPADRGIVKTATSRSGELTPAAPVLDEADVNADVEFALWEARRRSREVDPLYRQARQYADLTRALLDTLRPEIEAGGDAVLRTALDVIHWHVYAIPVKVRRALGGLLDPLMENEDDPIQSDCNGTAKLVRLMIAESRTAWEALLHGAARTPPARPAGMIDRLAALDASLAVRFPRAMEFVRPGFDE